MCPGTPGAGSHNAFSDGVRLEALRWVCGWAVRTMDTWRPIVDAETDVALQVAAAAAGILFPTPVRSLSGAIVESVDGHTWRAYELIHSGPPLVAPVSSTTAYGVGGILAKLHRLALPVDRISPYHRSRPSETQWRELLVRSRSRRAAWASALADAIPVLMDLASIGEGAPLPPPVLSINTLGPNGVRLGEGGRLIVVGWEHAGGQPPSWELVDALTKWAVDPDGCMNAAGSTPFSTAIARWSAHSQRSTSQRSVGRSAPC